MALQSLGSNTATILSNTVASDTVYAVFTAPKVVKTITYSTVSIQQENPRQAFYWS